ncbi:hypothetical protein FPJ29_00870 [Escherichia coli]|nr:hypothetical protein [Escherichia coli]
MQPTMHRQALASESGSPALRGIPLSKPSDHRLALLFAKRPGAVRIVFSNTPAKSNEAFSDTRQMVGAGAGVFIKQNGKNAIDRVRLFLYLGQDSDSILIVHMEFSS